MKLTKTCAKFLRKHGGTILAIGASIGVGLTMWETGKATVKATTLVTMNKDEPMTKKEIVKDCWKFYIPAAVVGAGTVACILGSNALNKKQLASMTAAYMALGKTYQEYRREVAERIGAEEEKKLRMRLQKIGVSTITLLKDEMFFRMAMKFGSTLHWNLVYQCYG